MLGSALARLSPVHAYLAVAAPLLLWLYWSTFFFPLFTYAFHEDAWEHTAAIKAWAANLWAPANPHLDVDAGSPRYMPFFFALAVLTKLGGLTPIGALKVSAAVNILILFAAIFLFFRTYFRSDWAPLLGLVVMLAAWGLGYRHSGEYQLRSLFYVVSYPSAFAFALSLIALWIANNALRGAFPVLWSHAALPVLFAIIFLTHPLTGGFALGAMGALAVTARDARFADRAMVILLPVAGVALAELWPYFSVWSLALGGGGPAQQGFGQANVAGGLEHAGRAIWHNHFYDPWAILRNLGPALLGIPCVLYLAWRRTHLFIVFGCLLMLGVYWSSLVIFPQLPVWVGGRFLLFATFFFHLALVAVILRSGPYWRLVAARAALPLRGKVLIGGIAVFLAASVAWSGAYSAAHFVYTYLRKRPVTEILSPIVRAIPEDAVILATTADAWPLPTFAGKVVSLRHTNPLVSDEARREQDVARFFDAGTASKQRVSILQRYGVSHVMFAPAHTPKSLVDFLNSVGSVAARGNGFVLVKLGSLPLRDGAGK